MKTVKMGVIEGSFIKNSGRNLIPILLDNPEGVVIRVLISSQSSKIYQKKGLFGGKEEKRERRYGDDVFDLSEEEKTFCKQNGLKYTIKYEKECTPAQLYEWERKKYQSVEDCVFSTYADINIPNPKELLGNYGISEERLQKIAKTSFVMDLSEKIRHDLPLLIENDLKEYRESYTIHLFKEGTIFKIMPGTYREIMSYSANPVEYGYEKPEMADTFLILTALRNCVISELSKNPNVASIEDVKWHTYERLGVNIKYTLNHQPLKKW